MDWEHFQLTLDEQINLKTRLKSPSDIDDAINSFTASIQTVAWSSSSPVPPKFTKQNFPTYVRHLIATKRRATIIWQRTQYPSDKRHYNNLTQKLKRTLSEIRTESFNKHLSSLTTKDNSIWKATKNILRTPPQICVLKNSDGTWATSDEKKAEIFREHLSSTFQPHYSLLSPIKVDEINTSLDSPLPMTMPPKHISPHEVAYLINKSNKHKSPGYDLITSEVAVHLSKKALLFLTFIYNSMIRLTYFPLLWKYSIIIMIHKPGKPTEMPQSFRPISLLPYFSKIFEKLILKCLLPIIENNLPNTQFGFRHNHSTMHQIHRLVDKIYFSLGEKLICTGVFLDVEQAFDRVWHQGLLYKIKALFPPYLYLLIKSYLSDRHFSVRSGTVHSNISKIEAGVPQGAVIAPLLFNIYTADQPTTQNTIVADFADDKALLACHSDPEIAASFMQTHLDLLAPWYTEWGLKLNQTKSLHSTFTLRPRDCPQLLLNNQPLPFSQNVKYLGLTLDRRLTWAPHIRSKRLTLNDRSRQLKHLLTSKRIHLKNKLLIYKMLLKPIWVYGIQLWGSAKPTNINRIQTYQSKTLRQITKAPYYVSNHTLHHDLSVPFVVDVAKTYYKRFHNRLSNHRNPLMHDISSLSIPGNLSKRLKRKWCRNLLTN